MSIPDLLNAPWAIRPEKYAEMCNIYIAHLRGEKANLEQIEAALGRPLDNKRDGYTVQSGVAIIPVEGAIAKKMNLFTRISGGTSSQALQQDLSDAAADPMVHSIAMVIDSPGGQVDGTQAAASMVRAIRDEGKKPIVALADGVMASAAYWIGSAASKVYITGDTTAVGSIGIIATHTDYSKAEADRGIKVTEITAGKYKALASQHKPLSDDGRADLQGMVDHLYSVFVDAVAANRGVSTKVVLDKMADGRVFLGKQAIAAGLVDGISNLDAIIAQLNVQRPKLPANTAGATKAVSSTSTAAKAESEAASAEISSATGIPTDADYTRLFNQYKGEKGMSQFDAMQRALREHTLEVQLAEVRQMHEQRASREQTNTEGETEVANANQSTTAPSEAEVIEQARALSARAQAYRAEVHRTGGFVTWLQAIEFAKQEKNADAGLQVPAENASEEEKIAYAQRLATLATTHRAHAASAGRRITIAQAVAEVLNQSKTAATAKPSVAMPVTTSQLSDEQKIERAMELSSQAQVWLAAQHKAGNTSLTIADAVMHVSKQ